MATYHEGELEVQRRAGVAANAERIGRGIHAEIPELARRFAEERRFLLVGAADAAGRVWATLLRGPAGFLSVTADDRLHVAALPRPEDPLAETLAGPADVGTLLIDPATRRRMRLNGRARPDGAGGIEIAAREVYANCPKYIHPRIVRLPEAGRRAERGAGRPAVTRTGGVVVHHRHACSSRPGTRPPARTSRTAAGSPASCASPIRHAC